MKVNLPTKYGTPAISLSKEAVHKLWEWLENPSGIYFQTRIVTKELVFIDIRIPHPDYPEGDELVRDWDAEPQQLLDAEKEAGKK